MRHGARLSHSARLQKLRSLLSDGRPHTSLEIIQACNTVNPATTVADLRDNGAEIVCRREKNETTGAIVAHYTMTKGPTA